MENQKTVSELEKLENKINRILSDRQEEISRLEEQITAEDDAISAANIEMEAATARGDLAEYRRAKEARQAAIDGKEMHTARKTALLERPLISENEYKKMVSVVSDELAAADAETKAQLYALSDQMSAVGEALRKRLDYANDILYRLQHEVYRDTDRSRNPKTGEILPLEHERAQVNPEFYSTVRWSQAGIENGIYSRYTSRKG